MEMMYTTTETVVRVNWRCTTCGRWIEDGQGYLVANPRSVSESWRPVHADCDKDPEGPGYGIDVESIRTYKGLLWWTAHLAGKSWIDQTDWFEIIREIAEAEPVPSPW